MATAALPLFHLYGDPPDDQAFDFIHIETIASRSSIHDWTIRAHRHRNLFQILLIERGGGEMTFEAATIGFEVGRLAASRARASADAIALEPTGATVEALRKLVEEHFHKERQLAFYADKLAMTVDRLNDHVKRATGVTAGHLIRQRVL